MKTFKSIAKVWQALEWSNPEQRLRYCDTFRFYEDGRERKGFVDIDGRGNFKLCFYQ